MKFIIILNKEEPTDVTTLNTLPGCNTYGTSNTDFIPVNFLTLHQLLNVITT